MRMEIRHQAETPISFAPVLSICYCLILSTMSSKKKKRTAVFSSTEVANKAAASTIRAKATTFGSSLRSRRVAVASFHAPNDHYIPPTTSSLEALLRDLKLDPVEKAETEAGISVKMKKKRYQNSVCDQSHLLEILLTCL